MTIKDGPIREFQKGALTIDRLNEFVRQINAVAMQISSYQKLLLDAPNKLPLPGKVTEVIAAGKYKVDVYLPPYLNSTTDDLSEDDLGTRIVKGLLWNVGEIGDEGGSPLVEDQFVDASVAGFDPSGLPLLKTGSAGGGSGTLDGPKTIGGDTEGSEAAETTTWDRDADEQPLTIHMVTRVAFYDAGDQKLYGYIRTFCYDDMGLLRSVSGEVRVSIDVPVICS